MVMNLQAPEIRELKPRITVFGVGGAGGNAVNNMIATGLQGVEFVVANTDAQALSSSRCERIIQMGAQATQGLGAGSQPDVGRSAAEEVIDEIRDYLSGSHMVFITGGMGGGTGTGGSPVVARIAREMGILTIGVVTKPFHFEGARRMRTAESGILEMQKAVDTLIVIPNQNLFRVATERTTFADAFAMADKVLYSGVACITDLMVKEGLINLDFADVRSVMRDMGKAMMGTGEASGEKRAITAAEAAIANPLLDDVSMRGAQGLLISITGGNDLTLYEVDEAATRIREEVDQDANIILGATFDQTLDGIIRVSVVATGLDLKKSVDAHTESEDGNDIVTIHGRVQTSSRLRMPQSPRPDIAVVGHPMSSMPLTIDNTALQINHEFSDSEIKEVLESSSFSESQPQDDSYEAHHAFPQQTPAESASPPSAIHSSGHYSEALYPSQQPIPKVFEDSRGSQIAPSSVFRPESLEIGRASSPHPLKLSPQPVPPLGDRIPNYGPHPEHMHLTKPVGNTVSAKRTSLLQRLLSVGFGSRTQEEDKSHAYPPMDSAEHTKDGSYTPDQRQLIKKESDPLGSKKQGGNKRGINEEHLEIPAFLRR
jgi:cell division protein FtsZ